MNGPHVPFRSSAHGLPNGNHTQEDRISQSAPAIGAGFDRRAIPADARETFWHAADGHGLRRIEWPGPAADLRGSMLFLPGRGDSYEKYLETFEDWRLRGWRVTALDWRGQGGSGRLGFDSHTGHVDDFAIWLADLGAFWREWSAGARGARVLVGHSMGGHLALRALADGLLVDGAGADGVLADGQQGDAAPARRPDAAILSAPMLDIMPERVPLRLRRLVAGAMARAGDARRPAWKWSEKPGEVPAARNDLLTHDAERYADELWWRARRPELVMGPGSWGWVRAALASIARLEGRGVLEAIETPVLLFGTRADRLVTWSAIERAAARLPHAELLAFGAEARHEILRELDPVRERALDAIDAFLDRHRPE